jgi:hypothetical protein
MSDRCASDHRLEGLPSNTHAALCTGVAASTQNADCAFLGARHHRAGSLVIKEEHWRRPGSGSAFAAVVRQIHAPSGAEALDWASVRECPPGRLIRKAATNVEVSRSGAARRSADRGAPLSPGCQSCAKWRRTTSLPVSTGTGRGCRNTPLRFRGRNRAQRRWREPDRLGGRRVSRAERCSEMSACRGLRARDLSGESSTVDSAIGAAASRAHYRVPTARHS